MSNYPAGMVVSPPSRSSRTPLGVSAAKPCSPLAGSLQISRSSPRGFHHVVPATPKTSPPLQGFTVSVPPYPLTSGAHSGAILNHPHRIQLASSSVPFNRAFQNQGLVHATQPYHMQAPPYPPHHIAHESAAAVTRKQRRRPRKARQLRTGRHSLKKRHLDVHGGTPKSPWKTVFCMEVGEAACSSRKNTKSKSKKFHRTFRGYEQVPADEDWDTNSRPHPAYIQRAGPARKPSLDLDITVRDLFPCFGDILDFCGCTKKKPKRAHVIPRSSAPRPSNSRHPKMETLCLECGHILNTHNLDRSVLGDAERCALHPHSIQPVPRFQEAKRHTLHKGPKPPIASQFEYGYGETPREWERTSNYSGYEAWDIAEVSTDGSPERRPSAEERVPLPMFELDESRKLHARPGLRSGGPPWVDSDYFDVDGTGRIVLPRFGTNAIA